MKSYRKFNLGLLIAIPVILGLYVVSIYYLYTDDKADSLSIQTYFELKEGLVKNIEENKILFSSGSNNFLGIRAYQIEENYNVPAVNLSIHAGLTTEYIIDRVKRIAKEGDIVILPLEYGNFTFDGTESGVLNKYLLSYDKPYFNSKFDFTEKLSILSSISVLDLFSNIFAPVSQDEKQQQKIKYVKNINSNGDMLNMTEHDSLKTKKNPFKLPEPISKETVALKSIKDFDLYCKKNNIYLYISFPNIVEDPAYKKENYNTYFNFLLGYFKANGIAVIGIPYDGMYKRELFFDSEYHLISIGSDIRTADFIKLMNEDEELLKRINSIKKN